MAAKLTRGRPYRVPAMALLTAVLLMAACSSDRQVAPGPSDGAPNTAAPSSHAPTPVASTTSSSRPATAPAVDWSTVMSGPSSAGVAIQAGWFTLRESRSENNSYLARAVRLDGSASWGYATKPGWVIQTVLATPNALYLVENEDYGSESRLLKAVPGSPPQVLRSYTKFVPEIVLVGGEVYDTTYQVSPPRGCLRSVSHPDKTAFCVPGAISRVHIDRDVLTFTAYRYGAGLCAQASVYWVDLNEPSTPHRVELGKCPFAGVARADLVAWTEHGLIDEDGGEHVYDSAVMARVGDDPPILLGRGDMGSTTICHGAIYWNSAANFQNPDANPEQLHRWTPASGDQIIWEDPDPKDYTSSIGTPACLDNGELITMTMGGNPFHEEVITTSTPPAKAAAAMPAVRIYQPDGSLREYSPNS